MRPKVVRSVHYCPATKKTMERKYTDMTSLDAFPSSAIYPTKVRSLADTFLKPFGLDSFHFFPNCNPFMLLFGKLLYLK